jgi:hypothetical protein
MNQHEIQLIQQIKGFPAVTITLPTQRTSPENQQDVIRVKNLVKQAVDRLLGEFTKREVEPLILRLDNLAKSIDYSRTLDGLALFVNSDFARMVYLPFALKERVVMDDSFYTRDLIFAMNRTPRYWVLALSEKPTRLYEGTKDILIELEEGGFPLVHTGPGGEQSLPGGFGVKKSAYRDEYHRKFFRQVDEALKPLLVKDPLPLAVIGVDRFLAFFDEVTSHKNAIIATLAGSHDKTSAYELGQLIWPVVKAKITEERQQVLGTLEKAIGEKKYTANLDEIWHAAKEGRARILLVEEDFHYPARFDSKTKHLIPVDDPTAADVMDDAVDEIIEMVLKNQGQVVFLDNGQLAEHQHIALILRY